MKTQARIKKHNNVFVTVLAFAFVVTLNLALFGIMYNIPIA